MSISFNSIPINIRTPGQYIEFDNSRALQGLPAMRHKILVIGQRLGTGGVAAGVPTRILSAAQAEAAFGRGAMLTAMLAALKAANSYTECWAVALDDNGAGAAATGTVTISGAPTEAGTLNTYIGGQLVQVGVASGATAASLATALAAAVNADTTLPVTAAAVGTVVSLSARHKGEVPNGIDIRVNFYSGERTPKGLATAVTGMTGGTANPDVQAAITAIGDEQFNTIVTPFTDAANLGKVEALLALRWGPLVQKEGQAFTAVAGTLAASTTLGATRNSPHLTIMGAGKSPTPTYVWAAVAAAVDAYEPDPARPRQTLPLPGLMPPATGDRWTRDERNLALFDGIATTVVDAGGLVLIERLITTYQTNAYGVDDASYLDIETMRTLAYLRLTVRARIATKFPRHKLAADGTQFGPGQAIVTPNIIRAELVALFMDWMDAGLAEGLEQFKRDLLVQRSATDPNRVDAVIPPDVINQFRVFAAQVQFRL
ncbi:phage tail sheath subtilisin-like domain-containing protein [Pelomonas aquatica]|jgi:phage tail sheath gpL-like|uniref:Phage tail protein n=1 Tax=Pelomonas aquatica TaxID=431058 RepID=A0A9X4LEK7_9BURK|nr:phage tail sheath subtilisin-like domain-containing protein [Pelomonas aquatica]MCY4753258.1 phage tail sheath subtilisin-like domain-containing protein [Pelomonas aquatica]MDG0861339.1 phage tail protein [Pelomonas aquatica]